MNQKVIDLINNQITKEFYSAYLYLDIANYYGSVGLDGFENWFLIQYREESDHALLLYRYLQNNGVKVLLDAIDAPNLSFDDNIEPLRFALSHEKYVTSLINDIYMVAFEDKDFRTMQMLDWFVKEQGEEEKNTSDLVTKMELFGDDAKSLYMLNSELAARVYNAPSLQL